MPRARDQRRLDGLRVIVGRVSTEHRVARPIDEAVDILHALTSFEMFDALAGTRRKTGEVLGLILQLVRADLGLPAQRAKGLRRRKPR